MRHPATKPIIYRHFVEEMTLKRAFSVVVNAIPRERKQAEFLVIFRAFHAGESYELSVTNRGRNALFAKRSGVIPETVCQNV